MAKAKFQIERRCEVRMEAKADIGDVDNDGIMDEVAHEKKRLVEEVEEEVYCRRGR